MFFLLILIFPALPQSLDLGEPCLKDSVIFGLLFADDNSLNFFIEMMNGRGF
jgi:hypothetical protein